MKTHETMLPRLTIEEKMELTYGRTNWTFFGNERLGLPTLMCGDGPHGLRAYIKDPETDAFDRNALAETTLFPVAAAMAATFQPDLIHKVGRAIGEECNMHNVDLLLAPGINLKRSPLGGRNFEYYSEDPYLTGVCGAAFVNGVQSTGVGATIKHYALNEQENQRRFIDTTIDERTLHELYLRPFKYVIDHANPMAVMSSYNRIGGHYGSESKQLLLDVLRDKWNYDGFVISDWGAVQHKVKSVKTGMNLEMPGPSEFRHELAEAIENGELTEAELDASLRPLFDFYDKVKDNTNKGKTANLYKHHEVAQAVAKEAIVLLENDGILPLQTGTKIGVVGTFADVPRVNGGGSATLKPYHQERPLDALAKHFDVDYVPGYEEEDTNDALLAEVRALCTNHDTIVYFTGTTERLETEGRDRDHMELPDGHRQVFEVIRASGKQVIVILNNGSSLDLTPLVGHVNALVEAWLLGGAAGEALADILVGAVNPSGRLAETFPMRIEHTPFYGEFPSKLDHVNYTGDLLRLGYRYYDTHQYPVRYPFGYGLSYTTFAYREMALSQSQLSDDDTLQVDVTIANTGTMDGYETVQLYVGDVTSYYPRPTKELRAFSKVFVKSGETATVSFHLSKDDFAIYSDEFHDFRVETGDFVLFVGPNVATPKLTATVRYETSLVLRTNLTIEHPLKNFKLYKAEAFAKLEERFGTFAWYNIEEPAIRVLKRMKRRHDLTDQELDNWIDVLLGD